MQVAIDARCLDKMVDGAEKQFLLTLLEQVVSAQPKVKFVLVGHSRYLASKQNVQYTQVPGIRSYWALRSWYRQKLPALLKKMQVQQLLMLNGCPAATTIPQSVFISSFNSLQTVYSGQFRSLAKRFLIKRLGKSSVVATFTPEQQNQLSKATGLPVEKIMPVGYDIPAVYQPVSWQQREHFLDMQTGGKEYFLVPHESLGSHFILLLKAFSLFKKRQQSSMQLIIAGQFLLSNYDPEKLETYKYRNDVVMLPDTNEAQMAMLIACAYATVVADEMNFNAFFEAAAMQCKVPVIGFNNNIALQQVAEDAALYADTSPENLAEKLKDIYKNENLRQQLIEQTEVQAEKMPAKAAAEKLWDCLKVAAAQNQPTFTAQ